MNHKYNQYLSRISSPISDKISHTSRGQYYFLFDLISCECLRNNHENDQVKMSENCPHFLLRDIHPDVCNNLIMTYFSRINKDMLINNSRKIDGVIYGSIKNNIMTIKNPSYESKTFGGYSLLNYHLLTIKNKMKDGLKILESKHKKNSIDIYIYNGEKMGKISKLYIPSENKYEFIIFYGNQESAIVITEKDEQKMTVIIPTLNYQKNKGLYNDWEYANSSSSSYSVFCPYKKMFNIYTSHQESKNVNLTRNKEFILRFIKDNEDNSKSKIQFYNFPPFIAFCLSNIVNWNI